MIVRRSTLSLLIFISLLAVTALSCSAVGNLPNPFASATPTATATFTPSVTPSPTPTFTPTATPTATPKPTGMAIHNVPGGGSQYLDYDAGLMIDIPPEWLAVKLDAEDIEAAISSMAKDNPGLASAIQSVQSSQSMGIRIFGFDRNPDHYGHGFVSNFNVLTSSEALAAKLPLDMLLGASVDQIKSHAPGAKVSNLGLKTNVHGLEIGVLEIVLPLKLPNGDTLNAYEKQMVFQTKTDLVVISLCTPIDKSTVVTPAFDKLMDQIQLIEE